MQPNCMGFTRLTVVNPMQFGHKYCICLEIRIHLNGHVYLLLKFQVILTSKIKEKVYVNEDESVSDLQHTNWPISFVFSL